MSGHILDPVRSQLGAERLASLIPSRSEEIYHAVGRLLGRDLWAAQLKDKQPSELRVLLAPVFYSYDIVAAISRCLLISQQVAVYIAASSDGYHMLLDLIEHMEQFIDEGLVILIPEEDRPPSAGTYHMEWGVACALNYPNIRPVGDIFLGADMAIALDYCRMFPNAVDLACPTTHHHELLRDVIDVSRAWADWASRRVDRPDHAGTPGKGILGSHDRINYLPAFLTLQLPALHLNAEDLVSVHHHGLFAQWKAALEEALRQAYLLDEDSLLDPDSARVRLIRDIMCDAERSTVRSVRRSRKLQSASRGTAKFTIAAASGALGTLDGATGAASAAGGAFLLSAIIDWLGGRPGEGQRAFRRMIPQIFGEDEIPLPQ
jgi:hypothetical protein